MEGVWRLSESTGCLLSAVLVITTVANSLWNWALIPPFLSSYSIDCIALSFSLSLPLYLFFFHQSLPHNAASARNCLTLLLISFISFRALFFTSSSIFLFLIFPLLSSPHFLGWIMLICWLKKTIVTSTRKQPNLFLPRDRHSSVCVCVCVCFLRAMADIRKGKIPHSFPAPSLCLAQGIIRPSKTGPCPPPCHIYVSAYTFVCVHVPVCVCACVPIFPPCGQVTIANQACKPCLKRPRERERGGWRNGGQMIECFPLSSSLKQR